MCIRDRYEEADSLRKYAFYIGEEQVLSYEENCREKEFEKVREIGLLRDAEQAVKEHDSTLLKELIDKMFQSSASYHPGILQDICEFCYQILYMIRRELENTGKEEQVAKLAISYEEIQKNGSEKFLRGIMDQALHSMESVSYTHLDVYKRQPSISSGSAVISAIRRR